LVFRKFESAILSWGILRDGPRGTSLLVNSAWLLIKSIKSWISVQGTHSDHFTFFRGRRSFFSAVSGRRAKEVSTSGQRRSERRQDRDPAPRLPAPLPRRGLEYGSRPHPGRRLHPPAVRPRARQRRRVVRYVVADPRSKTPDLLISEGLTSANYCLKQAGCRWIPPKSPDPGFKSSCQCSTCGLVAVATWPFSFFGSLCHAVQRQNLLSTPDLVF